MDLIENIIAYFKKPEKKRGASPEGTCPVCWGQQEYDGKIRKLFKDKQVDVNNHKDSYMRIQRFIKNNLDGFHLKEKKQEPCPDCGHFPDEHSEKNN